MEQFANKATFAQQKAAENAQAAPRSVLAPQITFTAQHAINQTQQQGQQNPLQQFIATFCCLYQTQMLKLLSQYFSDSDPISFKIIKKRIDSFYYSNPEQIMFDLRESLNILATKQNKDSKLLKIATIRINMDLPPHYHVKVEP